MLDVANAKYSAINTGCTYDLPLLAEIDILYNGGEFVGSPSLYFNETEDFAVKSNKIYLTGDLCSNTISADRDVEICYYQPVASTSEKTSRQSLAAFAQ